MAVDTVSKENAREKAMSRLYGLLELQRTVEKQFGVDGYNIFVFGSYVTTSYVEGQSDIDIAIYTEDFDLYKRIAVYLEGYFAEKGIESDIFYIDITMKEPIYGRPFQYQSLVYRLFPTEACRYRGSGVKRG